MNIEVLLSTMHETKDIIEKMNITSDCTIINQCDIEKSHIYKFNNNNIQFICSKYRGLSRSRNLAIDNAKGDIAIVADDDLTYVEDYLEIIKKAYEDNIDYDIIVFQVEGKNKKFKKYYQKERRLNYLTSMKVSSVEITFKVDSIKREGIRFNELLGSGAKYEMGEENVFLYDCLGSGLKIKYIPIKIADLYVGESSWFKGFNDKYFFDRGAVFTAMSRKFWLIFILQFSIRHFKIVKTETGFRKSINLMIKGHKDYIKCSRGEK